MVQKNFYIKNININFFINYCNFCRYVYDKKKHINYVIRLCYLLFMLKTFFLKLFYYYSTVYVKLYFNKKVFLNRYVYTYLKNKYKFTNSSYYSNLLKSGFVFSNQQNLFLFKSFPAAPAHNMSISNIFYSVKAYILLITYNLKKIIFIKALIIILILSYYKLTFKLLK